MSLRHRVTIAVMLLIMLSSVNTVRKSAELWIQGAGWVLIVACGSVIVWEVIRSRRDARGR